MYIACPNCWKENIQLRDVHTVYVYLKQLSSCTVGCIIYCPCKIVYTVPNVGPAYENGVTDYLNLLNVQSRRCKSIKERQPFSPSNIILFVVRHFLIAQIDF